MENVSSASVRSREVERTAGELSESQLRRALDTAVLQSLPVVTTGLGVLFVIFAVAHALVLPRFAVTPMVITASVTAAAMLLCARTLSYFPVPARWAHPIGAGVAGLVLFNSLLHLHLMADPHQTTNLMLLVVGAGFFFLSAPWLVLTITATFVSWAVIASQDFSPPAVQHYGFALLTSSILSALIYTVRASMLRRLERWRFRDERRTQELAAALASSEETRRQLEASKRGLEEMFQTVQEGAERFRRFTDLEGIAVHEHGAILECNPALSRMFQYDPAELLRMNVLQLIAVEAQALVRANLSSESPQFYEAVGCKKDGTTLPVDIVSKPVPFQGRRAQVVMIRDITERKRAEQALRDSEARFRELAETLKEADRRKDEFLAMLGHELRNPLAPIRSAAEVLRLLSPKDPIYEKQQAIIDRQIRHMVRLVDDLLDVSRITRGKILLRKERLDLVSLTRAVVEDHRGSFENAGVTLSLEAPAQPVPVLGDPVRLAQVVGNILHNANKFTNAGGQVCVRVYRSRDDTAAVVSVRDSGIGIDPQMLPRVFETFEQADRSIDRNRGGLGLGLALTKGLVEAHGGSVSATSEGLHRGAEFTMRFPLDRDRLPASPPVAVHGASASGAVE